MSHKAQIDLTGAMDLIKKSKYLLAPVFEAITNSLEAIANRGSNQTERGKITIQLYFGGLVQEAKELQRITVTDNGEGFNTSSFDRFGLLLDKSKGFNNRGSGRVQYLHRFQNIEVSSTFTEAGKVFTRKFVFDSNDFVSKPDLTEDTEPKALETTVNMLNFKSDKKEKSFFDTLKAEDVKNEIKRRFLLKLYLEQQKTNNAPLIEISFFKNEVLESNAIIDPKEIPNPEKGNITIPYYKAQNVHGDAIEWSTIPSKEEKLEWAHFKLPHNELDQTGVFLCSKDVAIQEIPYLKLKKGESLGGNKYLTAIYGSLLDESKNVSQSVDSFLFPTQKEVEKEAKENMFFDPEDTFIFMDVIEKQVKNTLSKIYTDIDTVKTEQASMVNAIALAHGIPEEIVKATNIDLSDSEEKITEKLYKKQADESYRQNMAIKRLFETLTELNPTEATYRENLKNKGEELLKLIPQQNKQELGRYVIRREMVTKVLQLILGNGLAYQKQPAKNKKDEKKENKQKEGLIHDLIFKRKSKINDSLNDLWILNEEFLHFEGCSELPLNQIQDSKGQKLLKDFKSEEELFEQFGIRDQRRPDIFLFMEEGKCVLIEFKAADIDLSDHLNQMVRYCNLIANCSATKIEQFFCYLIGENVNGVDLPGDFEKSIHGDFIKPNLPVKSTQKGKEDLRIASIFQEVIKLSSIAKRAEIRNKSFADKLGIRYKVD